MGGGEWVMVSGVSGMRVSRGVLGGWSQKGWS